MKENIGHTKIESVGLIQRMIQQKYITLRLIIFKLCAFLCAYLNEIYPNKSIKFLVGYNLVIFIGYNNTIKMMEVNQMSILLETKGLTKKYKNGIALNNVSIQVEKGTVYGLLGPNGAGKSTLLKIITRAIPKSSGEVMFENHLLAADDAKKIGAIIEHPAIYPNLTAYENLEVITTLLNIDRKKIDEVLSMVSLTNTGKKLAKEFSLGMKQRLGIAMALINSPLLLILDEPTNGLDPVGIQELRELIKTLSAHGITIILSSHILSEVGQIADKIGILNKGRLSYEGQNTNQSKLEDLFMEIIRKDVMNDD